MRLLHVIAGMDPESGGVCQAVRSIIGGLSDLGITNEVVSLDHPDQKFLPGDSFPVHALGPGKGPWCYSSRLIPWLVNNFPRFEVVIIHGLWLYPGYAVKKAFQLYTRQQKLPGHTQNQSPRIFVMPHGMLDPYFQHAAGRKLKAFRNYIYWKIIEGGIINNADKILFTSEEECKLAAKTFIPYHPKEVVVVGLGVDAPPHYTDKIKEAFTKKCPGAGNTSYILFLSRIHEKKGLDFLVNAYDNVINKKGVSIKDNGNIDFPKLIIAGPGLTTAYGEMIQKKISASPVLSQNVFFTGMLDGDAKWGAFYGCKAFVLPSHQENFGIAVVEAMACQKPVLISDKVNIWGEIKKSGSGIIANATLDGTEQLLKSWLELTNEKKAAMGINAGKLYQDIFAVEPAAKQLASALL